LLILVRIIRLTTSFSTSPVSLTRSSSFSAHKARIAPIKNKKFQRTVPFKPYFQTFIRKVIGQYTTYQRAEGRKNGRNNVFYREVYNCIFFWGKLQTNIG